MRGLRRHQEPGLDEDRRTLIHRYMVDAEDPPEPDEPPPPEQPRVPLEQSIDLPVPEPVAPADPLPVPRILHVVPRAPEPRHQGAEDPVDAFRQTLEQVARLSGQMAEARSECSRRREQLAAMR